MTPDHEVTWRVLVFGTVLAAMTFAEALAPRRGVALRRRRWPGNLGLLFVDVACARLVLPAGLVGLALVAEARDWGLFALLALPAGLATVIAIVVLDLAVYGQHVLFHHVPWLWRLHRVHHADVEIDVTTGVRFHPAEILASLALKGTVVLVLGASPVAVLLFEILLNATSLFNHADVRLPRRLDEALRWLVVTPDMHRVHHSAAPVETNSNYGFSLPWWDRIFGTYRDQPMAGHAGMTVGLTGFRDDREFRLDRLLLQPLRQDSGGTADVTFSSSPP